MTTKKELRQMFEEKRQKTPKTRGETQLGKVTAFEDPKQQVRWKWGEDGKLGKVMAFDLPEQQVQQVQRAVKEVFEIQNLPVPMVPMVAVATVVTMVPVATQTLLTTRPKWSSSVYLDEDDWGVFRP